MNTGSARTRRQERLADADKPLETHRVCGPRNIPPPPQVLRPASKLPEPWLFDSESLLRELDRCSELVNQIDISNPRATHFSINVAASALWNLRENLRYLLKLHSEGQSRWKRQGEQITQHLTEHPIAGAEGMKLKRVEREASELEGQAAQLRNEAGRRVRLAKRLRIRA